MTREIPLHADLILQKFTAGITKFKSEFIIGIYVTGSITLNDFHPNKSDIDFLILCNAFPTVHIRLQLEQIHKKIESEFKKPKLNGCYITSDALHVQNAGTTKILYYHEGQMYESPFEMAPVTLFELRTTAITICGTPAHELPVTVGIDDLNKFLSENINSYWKNWVTKHSSFGKHHLLLILFPRLSEWVILGIARQLYSVKTGKIASKTDSGYYCMEYVPEKHHAIIQKVIKIRKDKRNYLLSIKQSYYIRPSKKRALDTLACANFLIHLFNKEYCNKSIRG